MTKFQKIQIASSIIPVYSSFFVFAVTMVELKKHKASGLIWLSFNLIFFLSGITVFLLDKLVMPQNYSILHTVVYGLILAVANILCVNLQSRSKKEISASDQNT